MMLVGAAYRIWAVVVPLVVVLTVGCSRAPVSREQRPNVLLVVVDTLRADRLGCYGARRETSPAVDALAATAVRFEKAYATAPWTIPSVASMFTGLYPQGHAATSFGLQLPDELETLAETFRDAGYRTAGVVSHVAVDSRHNFDQGFEVYLESEARGHDHLSTAGVTRQALEQLESMAKEDAPFLLFAHYFDPHYNYMRHSEFGFAAPSAGRLDGTRPMRELLELAPEMSGAEASFLRDLYDEEIRFTDRGIGRLLERLDELGLREETIVVLTADHGEEFLDHGGLGHTGSLYQELIHVPLIVRRPGAMSGSSVVTRPVSLVSLMPTLLDLAGVEFDARRFHGPSLAPLLDGGQPEDEPLVFVEVDFVPVREGRLVGQVHKKAILGERYKLIRDDSTGERELYDLPADPRETANLAETDESRLERLEQALAHVLATSRHGAAQPQPREVDGLEIEKLKSLGYVGD